MTLSKQYKEAKDVTYYLEERYHEIKVHWNTFTLIVKNFTALIILCYDKDNTISIILSGIIVIYDLYILI